MPMNYENLKEIEILDEIRLNRGIDRMKSIFYDLVKSNPEKAIKSINDKNVQFASLFLLRPETRISDIFTRLSARNKYALEITNGILSKEILNTQRFSSEYKQDDYLAIKWILETGYIDDGLNDQYDEVLDAAAIILAKVYKDRSCLSIIEEMIFSRYRKGAFIYDLVWVFFEVSDSENLIIMANRLRSSNRKDVELARKFLNFVPCIGMNSEEDHIKQYQCSLRWLKQNKDFLYYTGETCLQTSNPYLYAVSLEAKYLQKTASSINGELSRSLTEGEVTCLDRFKKLDAASKLCLSNYSSILYRKSKYRWGKWLKNPIDKQIEIAKRMLGGLQ
ncbi:MAG: hypothetical protein ACYDG2_20490 [Ruminiclostridium sp.]